MGYNNDFIEWEVGTSSWPLWTPHPSQATGEEGLYCPGLSDLTWLSKASWLPTTKGAMEDYDISRELLDTPTFCD